MRKFALLVLAAAGLLTYSCKKIDAPLPKKLCQIKKVTRTGSGPTPAATLEYFYNDQRDATQLTITTPSGALINYHFNYGGNDNRLILVAEENGIFYNLYYQGGLLRQ